MSNPIYTSSDFTTARIIESRIEYPFINEGDNVSKIYHFNCAVRKSHYAPIALDVVMNTATNVGVIDLPYSDTAAYFVGDYDHTIDDGEMMIFRRVFARIPVTRSDIVTEPLSYTFPGVTSGNLSNAIQRAISSISYSASTERLTINTDTGTPFTGLSSGDTVFVELQTSSTSGATTTNFNYNSYRVANNAGTSQIQVPHPPITGTLSSGKVYILREQASPMHATVAGTFTKYQYFLPGVSTGIVAPSDVLPSTLFQPYSTFTGESVIVLSDTTQPTAAAYKTLVAANSELIIDSRVTKFMGNIILKSDKSIIAI